MNCKCGIELRLYRIYRRGSDEELVWDKNHEAIEFYSGLSGSRQIGIIWAFSASDASVANSFHNVPTQHDTHVSRWAEKNDTVGEHPVLQNTWQRVLKSV